MYDNEAQLDFPDELEAERLGDEVLARAYEAVSPQIRARLKTTQSLLMALFGKKMEHEEQVLFSMTTGYKVRTKREPAPWALFYIRNGCCGAARLAAAVMAARLSGVDAVVVVFSDQGDIAPENLVSLELCGVEDIFVLSDEAAEIMLKALARNGRGRLVGAGMPEPFSRVAREAGFPCHELPCSPRIQLDVNLDEEERAAVTALFPEARLVSPDDFVQVDVHVHPESVPCDQAAARVAVELSLAGCFVDPDLLPSFFVNTSYAISML